MQFELNHGLNVVFGCVRAAGSPDILKLLLDTVNMQLFSK